MTIFYKSHDETNTQGRSSLRNHKIYHKWFHNVTAIFHKFEYNRSFTQDRVNLMAQQCPYILYY